MLKSEINQQEIKNLDIFETDFYYLISIEFYFTANIYFESKKDEFIIFHENDEIIIDILDSSDFFHQNNKKLHHILILKKHNIGETKHIYSLEKNRI